MLRAEEHLGPALRGALEALELARWDDLPEAQLPWEDVGRVGPPPGGLGGGRVWDLCGRRARHRAEADSKRRKRRKTAKPG